MEKIEVIVADETPKVAEATLTRLTHYQDILLRIDCLRSNPMSDSIDAERLLGYASIAYNKGAISMAEKRDAFNKLTSLKEAYAAKEEHDRMFR